MDIKLTWKNRSTGTLGTRIYRSTQPIDLADLPEPIATIDPELEEYVDTGLEFGKEYYYRISTFNETKTVYSFELKASALPYSGPGPQEIVAGDIEAGFYGVLSSGEFIDTRSLMTRLGINFAIINESPRWFKYSYKGKTLYFPTAPLTYSTSWLDIYNQGLIYGTDDFGPIEENWGITRVNQLRTITLNNDTFIVRAIQGMSNPNWNNQYFNNIQYEMIDQEGCEWNDLVSRSYDDAPLIGLRKPKFMTGVVRSEMNVNYTMAACQDFQRQGSSNLGLFRGGYNYSLGQILVSAGRRFGITDRYVTNPYNGSSYYLCWRPVLELVP